VKLIFVSGNSCVVLCERHPACKPHLRSHKPDTPARSWRQSESRGPILSVMENWYASATTKSGEVVV